MISYVTRRYSYQSILFGYFDYLFIIYLCPLSLALGAYEITDKTLQWKIFIITHTRYLKVGSCVYYFYF